MIRVTFWKEIRHPNYHICTCWADTREQLDTELEKIRNDGFNVGCVSRQQDMIAIYEEYVVTRMSPKQRKQYQRAHKGQ